MEGRTKRQLIQAGRLGAGCLLGLAAAWWVTGIRWEFPGEIRKARELGIVSLTVLAGYPKSRDLVTYLAVLGLPVLFALALWLPWAWRKRALLACELAPAGPTKSPPRDLRWLLCLAGVALVWLVLPFNRYLFYGDHYSPQVGGWMFLGEEGEFFAWVQSIFDGGVQGRDFFCQYGPMMLYPLAWLMRVFGESVIVSRGYAYAMNLLAGAVMVAFLWAFMRRRWVFVGSSLFLLLFYWQLLQWMSPNLALLRVALGLVPLLLLHYYRRTGRSLFLAATGVVLGQGFLFSQEVALCALIAAVSVMAYEDLPQGAVREFARKILLLGAWCLASVLPLLLYFFAKGALGSYLADLYGYPRLIMMGYAGLPFPPFREFLARPLATNFFEHYWIIFVYVFTAIRLAPPLLAGRRDEQTLLRLSLLLFGALLYRTALARVAVTKAEFVSPPAFLLLFLLLDGAVAGCRRSGEPILRAVNLAGVTLILGLLAAMPFRMEILKPSLGEIKAAVVNAGGKLDAPRTGREVPGLARYGGQFTDELAAQVILIRDFLDRYTTRGEYVYFFPNDAAFYFLFDRRMPTRYPLSYLAATRAQRRELVADIERTRPRYVVVSRTTWRIDDIPEEVQVPEVVEYLRRTYGVFKDLGPVLVMARREG